jgi:lipoprotein-releasing system permease protein
MSTEFFIAKRYLFSKRKFTFITIISLISILGVTIGVAALIIVLSVFNGFNKKVTDILVGFDPHIRIESKNPEGLEDYNELNARIRSFGVENSSPFTLNKGMLASHGSNKVIFIKGVDESDVGNVSGVEKVTELGEFDLSDNGDFGGIVLGLSLMDKLKSRLDDTITVLSPVGLESSLTQFVQPLTKKFIVRGIFISENPDYDNNYAYISLENSQYLFEMNNKVSGIEIRLDNINRSESEKAMIQHELGNEYEVKTWYDLHADFYSILQVERWTTFIILSLIIAVASFNILGSLTMTVIEKKRDIGVLKAVGATDEMITKIFLFEGISVGLIGMITGTIIGLGITLAQKYFEFYKIDSSVYIINALPVELKAIDLIMVPLAALILCFLASLYPSRRAAKQDPVDSIRWE